MSEVKKVRMYQLASDRDACSKRRAFTLVKALQGKQEPNLLKSGIGKRTVNDLVMKLYEEQKTVPTTDDEAKAQAERVNEIYKTMREEMKKEFEDLEYSSEFQRAIQADDSWRDIVRLVDGLMKRKHNWDRFKKGARDVELDPKLVVESVNPDFIDVLPSPVDENGVPVAECELQAILLKFSKPKITEKSAYDALELYALIKYLKARTTPGHKVFLRASIYYMRKANDSNGSRPVYDQDFFDVKGGRNIVSIDTIYEAPADGTEGTCEIDEIFAENVKQFIAGIPEQECDESDCEKCELFDSCKFCEAPDPIPETPSIGVPLSALNLTDAQLAIIEYVHGILRCNAGAGGGKTLTVALRTATLLNMGVLPEEILLITFTNSGAEEMRSRVKRYCVDMGIDPSYAENVKIMTFNAFGDMVIGEKATELGFSAKPKIVDDVERGSIIKQLLADNKITGLDFRNFSTKMKNCKGALAMTSEIFEIAKAGMYGVADTEKVYSILKERGDIRFVPGGLPTIESILKLYNLYDEKMREDNLIEFVDQEVLLFEVLHKDPTYLNHFGFKHIICDEFQDSNAGQIKLLRMFTTCPSFESLMVVGDDSQAIFGFRDTRPDYMVNFDKCLACPEEWLDSIEDHLHDLEMMTGGAKVDDINLLENHRSTPEILEFANKLNEKNTMRVAKNLIATRPSGKPVVVQGFLTREEEQDFVVNGIKQHLNDGVLPESIAVIAATKYELMELGDVLSKNGIPSVMLNPEPLIENSRVRAAIALVNAVDDENDSKDLLTYVNALKRGQIFKMSDTEIEDALKDVQKDITALRGLTGDERKAKLLEMLREINHNEDEVYQSFIDTLEAKRNSQAIYQYCHDFYEFGANNAVRRVHNYPGVVLTTSHSSKGLEWKIVYNMISKYDTSDMANARRAIIEERRRLLYVSATRARDELYITSQYVAFGKKGDYHYNRFLIDAMDCVGEKFDPVAVEAERDRRAKEKKAAQTEEKKKSEQAAD